MTEHEPEPWQKDGVLRVQHGLPLATPRIVATWEMDDTAWASDSAPDADPLVCVYVHDLNADAVSSMGDSPGARMRFSDAPTHVQMAFIEQMGRIYDLRAALLDTPVEDDTDSVSEILTSLEETDVSMDVPTDGSGGGETNIENPVEERSLVDEAVSPPEDDDE